MGLADLHLHTLYSWDGTSTVTAILKQVMESTLLDVIAITDHDTLTGALEAIELGPYYGIEVIPGCEISTAEGHLLAYFITSPVPQWLSLKETVLRVGEMGGLCIAAHPSAHMANSLHPQAICEALEDPDVKRVLVGIEVFNAKLVHKSSNRNAQELAVGLPVAQVSSSDAHVLEMIGRGSTYFDGSTADELRYALENRMTCAVAGPSYQADGFGKPSIHSLFLHRAGMFVGSDESQSPIRLRSG